MSAEPSCPDRLEVQVTSRSGTRPLITERDGALVRIGRQDKDNTWPTASFKDPQVSQEHLELTWDCSKREWTCQDMGSSNGTQLNSRTLQPQEVSAPLKTGDLLCLGGSTTLLIEVWPPAQPEATVEDYLNALQKQLHSRCQAQWESKANEWRANAVRQLDARLSSQ